MATPKKRKGGWPKRPRQSVLLSTDPKLLTWYSKQAARSKRSRNALIEGVLGAVAAAVNASEDCFRGKSEWSARYAWNVFEGEIRRGILHAGLLSELFEDHIMGGVTAGFEGKPDRGKHD